VLEKVKDNALELLLNQFVKVLFKDGANIRSIKGNLISYSPQFITIQTRSNTFLLHKNWVFKIQSCSPGNGDARI